MKIKAAFAVAAALAAIVVALLPIPHAKDAQAAQAVVLPFAELAHG